MANTLHIRRFLALFVCLSAAALIVAGIRYFSLKKLDEQALPPLPGGVNLALNKIHFKESAAGQIRWELTAASGAYDKAAEKSLLQDVRFIVQRETAVGPITVTARKGEYGHVSKKVNLSGKVVAIGEKGLSFETEKVDYDATARRFSTAEKVKLVDGALSVEGVGMEMLVDKREARIHHQVVAVIDPAKQRQ